MKLKLKRLLKNIVLPLSQRQTPAGELVTTPAAPRLEAPSGCFAGGYETAAVQNPSVWALGTSLKPYEMTPIS